jgi:hypothetical protein
MQKKQLIFILVSLGILSIIFINPLNVMGEIEDSFSYLEEVPSEYAFETMPMDIGMPDTMMQEPDLMMGIAPRYYEHDALLDVSQRSYQISSYHSVVVRDVSTYIDEMTTYFSSINGIVLNSSISSREKYNTASLYVKVPVEKFDEATNKTTLGVDKIVNESINSVDITGQVVNSDDAVISLEDQKIVTEAFLKDAKTETEKAKLKIEIQKLEDRIVAAQKNKENVQNKTEYASISISAANSEKYYNPGHRGDFYYEVDSAWQSLKSFVKVALVFGIWLAVYSVVWAPIVWISSKIFTKFKK